MVCSNGTCVALAKPGRRFCTIHDAHYRKVEPGDLAAGRICRRCQRKLVKGEWVQAEGDALTHVKVCGRPAKDAPPATATEPTS
jgi:hypothetical protein